MANSNVHVAGGDVLKIGLVGCGGRGNGAATQALNTKNNVVLWAMGDLFEDRVEGAYDHLMKGQDARYDRSAHEGFARKIDCPKERRFVGFDACAKVLASGIDLVILATPPGFRPMQYQAAVEAGKHVFMEKPCCVDAPGFKTLMAANKVADEKNLKVGVGLQRHHQAHYVEAMKRIKDGALGDIQYLRMYWNGSPIWIIPRKPGWTDMEYQIRNWNIFTWISGDHICEQHVHNLDVSNWIMDAHPVEANGMGGRQVRTGKDMGYGYDHHAVEFTYADGTKMFSQCRQIANCWSQVGEVAIGTKATAELSHGDAAIRGADSWRYRGKETNPYDQEHIDLQEAVLEDKKMNEGWFAATSSMTGVLGRMATYSGKVVKWDDAVAKGKNLLPEKLALDAPVPFPPDENDLYEYAQAMPGVYDPFTK